MLRAARGGVGGGPGAWPPHTGTTVRDPKVEVAGVDVSCVPAAPDLIEAVGVVAGVRVSRELRGLRGGRWLYDDRRVCGL